MIRLLMLMTLGLTMASAVAPATAADRPNCKRRDLCVLSGVVRNVRLTQSPSSPGSYRLSAVLAEETSATHDVAISTDQGRTLTLKPGPLTRRASVEVYAGTPSEKSVVVSLKLFNEDKGTACSGQASLDLARGKYDADFIGGETSCRMVRFVQAHPTQEPGTWAITFTAIGDASARIAGGVLQTETIGTDGRPVTSVTPLDASSFTTEREYFTDVRFDGDPVGAEYELDVQVSENGKRVEQAKTSLDVIQLPGDGQTPGVVFGIAGNGSGTKNPTTTTSTKPELL